jgi:hypothetical protein
VISLNNEITPELIQATKENNKVNAIQYDEKLREKKDAIIEYYKEQVSLRSTSESLLEIMCDVIEKFEIDEDDLANILKNDETMLNALHIDCVNRNLLKEKNKHINIGDIFE